MKNIKTKDITLNDVDIKIRRIKVRELKDLIKDMATKVTEVVSFIYDKSMSDTELSESIPKFIVENIEFFEKYILMLTVNFTQEDLDDLDFLDLIDLVKEIISFNGVNEGFIKSFFQNLKKVNQATVVTTNNFIQDIPKA